MIPDLDLTMRVHEAYLDAEDTPTIALNGAGSDLGPITALVKGVGLDLEGVTIGQAVVFRLRARLVEPEMASRANLSCSS